MLLWTVDTVLIFWLKTSLLLKSVDKLQKIHEAQILTYMRLAHLNIGLLINFNEIMLKNGIKRFVL